MNDIKSDWLLHPNTLAMLRDLEEQQRLAHTRLREACAGSNDPVVREAFGRTEQLNKLLEGIRK